MKMLRKANIVFYKEHFENEECIKQLLRYLQVEAYAYVLHNKDILEETGEEKKAHYHLCVWFCGYHSIDRLALLFQTNTQQIKNLLPFNDIPYLIHYFNKDKHKYGFEEIKHEGFDISMYFTSEDQVCNKANSKLKRLIDITKYYKCISSNELIQTLEKFQYYDLLEYYLKNYKQIHLYLEKIMMI